MVRHMVMWRFTPDNKQEGGRRLKEMLEALPPKIPQIRRLEAGIHANPDARGWDMALTVDFDGFEELAAYKAHPDHKAVSAFCASIREDRAAVDYVIE